MVKDFLLVPVPVVECLLADLDVDQPTRMRPVVALGMTEHAEKHFEIFLRHAQDSHVAKVVGRTLIPRKSTLHRKR